MKLLVLGLGAIGQRHVRLAKELVGDLEVLALRSGQGINYVVTDQLERVDCESLSKSLGISETYDINKARDFGATHVVDSRLPRHHLDEIGSLATNAERILVEKPLSILPVEKIEKVLSNPGLINAQIFVGYHLLQNKLIHRLHKYVQNGKVYRYKMRNIEHIKYFQSFRNVKDMHESSLEESGGLCYAFSHLIHLSHAFFGTPVSVRRDNWHDDISPITGTNVRQYEVLMFKHNSFSQNVTGVIELGYGSHKPELTIEFDTENCSYRANLLSGTLETWEGGELTLIEQEEATKIELLRRQMSKFLGTSQNSLSAEGLPGLCCVEDALQCLRLCEKVLR